ncbi:hypothetical protein D3P96_07510 [Weissella viridescens]|uniref:Uncharacterized protein n=1 Tax=Weissella viridescens TaxID=1629 RepID=A0A3P2RDN3_WEIVI|nr:hypothetical protein [Weissella viridescens]RRG17475.1 hypothetical protein D3P96_07510 [Weissella viridescens]
MKKKQIWLVILGVVVLLGGSVFAGAAFAKHHAQKVEMSASSSSLAAKERSMSEASSKAASESKASSESQAQESSDSATMSSESHTSQSSVNLTAAQAEKINQAFNNWAGERAKMGHMAVTNWYFDHGAAGRGDWYADSPDGEIQVQNQDNPGKAGFKIHSLGGCVFYKSKSGKIGQQDLSAESSIAGNYSVDMNFDKPISKYLLGDNGVVYELKLGNGSPASTNTGFGEYNDDGEYTAKYAPDETFQVSEDAAAQSELKALIAQYQ